MRYFIDPTVDCVFKAFGALEHPITSVTIENPYNDKKQLDAKLSVVDIMAKDDSQNIYQIELQLTSPKHLSSRMSFNLTQLHSRQLIQGEEFGQVRRTFTIWLCTQDVPFKYSEAGPNDHDYRFVMYDKNRATLLNEDFEIHVVIGSVNLWWCFLQQFVCALSKALVVKCSHLHKSTNNTAQGANKCCPKGSFQNILLRVARYSLSSLGFTTSALIKTF